MPRSSARVRRSSIRCGVVPGAIPVPRHPPARVSQRRKGRVRQAGGELINLLIPGSYVNSTTSLWNRADFEPRPA